MNGNLLIKLCLLISLTSCGGLDPDTPDFDSSVKSSLPEMEVEATQQIHMRQADLKVRIVCKDEVRPTRLALCYSKDSDLPDISMDTVDLLPVFTGKGMVVCLENLLPSTQYHCRVYAEMRTKSGYSEVCRFTTKEVTEVWTRMGDLPETYDMYSDAVVVGQDVYIRGGKVEDLYDKGDFAIWRYTPSSGIWGKIPDFPGGLRTEMTLFNIDTKLYAGLGCVYLENRPNPYKRDIWEYDTLTGQWKGICDYPREDNQVIAAFGWKGKGFVVSRTSGEAFSMMNVFVYDPSTNVWIKKSTFPGSEIGANLFALVNNRAYIICGGFPVVTDSMFSKNIWEYDMETDTWRKCRDFPGTGRWNPRGFAIGDDIYVGFGEEEIGTEHLMQLVNDWWCYSTTGNSWGARTTFGSWLPGFFTLSFGMGEEGYIGAKTTGMWKYSPEKDK